jgi:hypothetical protein
VSTGERIVRNAAGILYVVVWLMAWPVVWPLLLATGRRKLARHRSLMARRITVHAPLTDVRRATLSTCDVGSAFTGIEEQSVVEIERASGEREVIDWTPEIEHTLVASGTLVERRYSRLTSEFGAFFGWSIWIVTTVAAAGLAFFLR